MKIITTLLLAGALAGCGHPIPLPTGHAGIMPTGGLEVGHLYFSGAGSWPAFETTSGTVYNKLCYNDFAKDNALKAIDQYVVPVSGGVTSFNSSANGELTAGVSNLLGKAKIGASAKREYVVSGIKRFELTGEGMQIVSDNIGDNCRNEIRSLQRDNRHVIILLAALQADSIDETIEGKVDGQLTVTDVAGIEPVVAQAGSKQVVKYEMVYLSGLLSER